MPKLRTAFYHVNKCAGTTLLNYFLSIYPTQSWLRLEHAPADSLGIRRLNDVIPIAKASFIHDPTGVTNWNAILGNTFNIMWLRDPVDRVISQIKMIGRWTDEEANHPNLRLIRDAARDGIQSFMATQSPLVHPNCFNGITAFLQFSDAATLSLWRDPKMAGVQALETRALDLALRNIECMDYIGRVETFDADFTNLCQIMNRAVPSNLQRLNTGQTRAHIDAADRAAIMPYVQLDHMVLAYARDLFARKSGSPGLQPKREPPVRSPIPSAVIVNADQFLTGDGWHVCETNGAKISRWTGPENSAKLSVAVRKEGDLFVRLAITDYRQADQINQLHLIADGWKTGLSCYAIPRLGIVAEAWVPGDRLNRNDPFLDLEINFGRSYRSNNRLDERSLGIELTQIEIGPAQHYQPHTLRNLTPWIS